MSENEKSQFAARIAEMSAGIKEQGKALIERARAFFSDQAAVVRAWGELQAEKLGISADEELIVAALEDTITADNIERIDLNQVVADIYEKIKFKLAHPNRLEFSGNKLMTILTLYVCFILLLSACGSPARAFSNTEAAATVTSQGTEDLPTPTAYVQPTVFAEPTLKPTEIIPTIVPTLEPPVDISFDMPAAFAAFEKQFPLSKVNEFAGYILRCSVDGASIQTGNIDLGGGLDMRAWTSCYFKTPDGKTDFVNIPIYVVNQEKNQHFTAFYPDPQPLPPGGKGYSPNALEKAIPRWLKILSSQKVFVMGFGFGSSTSSADASQSFFATSSKKMSEDAAQKLANGDTSALPTIGGINHFLPAFEFLTDTVK